MKPLFNEQKDWQVVTFNLTQEKVHATAFFVSSEGALKWLEFLKTETGYEVLEERITWAKVRLGEEIHIIEVKGR